MKCEIVFPNVDQHHFLSVSSFRCTNFVGFVYGFRKTNELVPWWDAGRVINSNDTFQTVIVSSVFRAFWFIWGKWSEYSKRVWIVSTRKHEIRNATSALYSRNKPVYERTSCNDRFLRIFNSRSPSRFFFSFLFRASQLFRTYNYFERRQTILPRPDRCSSGLIVSPWLESCHLVEGWRIRIHIRYNEKRREREEVYRPIRQLAFAFLRAHSGLKKSTSLEFFPKETMIHFGMQFSRTDLFVLEEYLQFFFLTKLMKIVEII